MGAMGERAQKRSYRPLHRKWPKGARKAIWWMMPLELIGLIPLLVVFGISQPDLYRTDLWRIGFDNKLNSNPNMILYAYANHEPLPTIPLIWSQTLTNLNVAISVVSLFFLLAKLISFIMRLWFPLAALIINIAITAIYSVSIYGQIGPDHADSRYPASVAWYFKYGCDMARPYNAYKSCQIAQSSLGVTLYMLVIYVISIGLAIWAMVPHPRNNFGSSSDDDEDDHGSNAEEPAESSKWEMQSMKSPMNVASMPYTPRTQAFRTLDRQR